MLGGIVPARGVGEPLLSALDSWPAATRMGPAVDLRVTMTGVAGLVDGVGLLVPALARWAAYRLIAPRVAVFPANVPPARGGHTIGSIGLLRWSMPTPGA
ncbi:MAG TPA: hypothetical protein VNK43_07470 [Gemmatimonadales bacterium]|nr:hypothetical protein [Gemmatimonadales bacterium]